MTAASASDRQQHWLLLVRRSFGIPDVVGEDDARRALIRLCQDQLEESGWQSPTRAIAEPIMDALVALGTLGELEDLMVPSERRVLATPFDSRDAAHRLIDKGMSVVDPEHLAFDAMSEYPSEVLAVAQRVLDHVSQYVRQQPFNDPGDVI